MCHLVRVLETIFHGHLFQRQANVHACIKTHGVLTGKGLEDKLSLSLYQHPASNAQCGLPCVCTSCTHHPPPPCQWPGPRFFFPERGGIDRGGGGHWHVGGRAIAPSIIKIFQKNRRVSIFLSVHLVEPLLGCIPCWSHILVDLHKALASPRWLLSLPLHCDEGSIFNFKDIQLTCGGSTHAHNSARSQHVTSVMHTKHSLVM